MPLLVGTDGSKKMSQSSGNYIGVEDEPAEMFGKTMSIPDSAMPEWFAPGRRLRSGRGRADRSPGSPTVGFTPGRPSAVWLAPSPLCTGVRRPRRRPRPGSTKSSKTGEYPTRSGRFMSRQTDPVLIPNLIRDAIGISGSEARRMLKQRAVRIDGEVMEAEEAARDSLVGRVLQVGKTAVRPPHRMNLTRYGMSLLFDVRPGKHSRVAHQLGEALVSRSARLTYVTGQRSDRRPAHAKRWEHLGSLTTEQCAKSQQALAIQVDSSALVVGIAAIEALGSLTGPRPNCKHFDDRSGHRLRMEPVNVRWRV